MKRMPKTSIAGSVAQCAHCFEAYLVTDGMTDEQVETFRKWHEAHGVKCERTPLTQITSYTFSVLANLPTPGH